MSLVGRIESRAGEAVLTHILRALWQEVFSDHATVIAAGLAYYAVFGLLPAVAAATALWGLFGDPAAVLQSMPRTGGAMLPQAAIKLLQPFVTSVPQGFGGGLALLLNLLLVVWTAVRAAGGLITALNIVYDVEESRSRLRRSLIALGVGVGGIAMLFVAVALLALAPLVATWLQDEKTVNLMWTRWPALVGLLAAGMVLLFRYGADRTAGHSVPLGWGVLAATTLCLLASVGISLYVANFADYGRLYGSLGGLAVALFWLYACSLSLLVGAEIDAVLISRRDHPKRDGRSDAVSGDGAEHREAQDEEHDGNNHRDPEQDLHDSDGNPDQTAEAEYGQDDGDDENENGSLDHMSSPWVRLSPGQRGLIPIDPGYIRWYVPSSE